jgi:predicted porin
MNKKLIVLAVAGAIGAPGLALAQTSNTPTSIVPSPGVASSNGITLYGRLDETIMINKYSANGAGTIPEFKKGDVYSPGNAMGIRGREDLGGGTSAWFQLEIGVWPSERLDTATTTGNNWGGRNSAVGISSGIGDVLAGNWDTPYKQVFGVWNSMTSGGYSAAGILMGNGDSTGALNNALCQSTVNNGSGAVTVSSATLNVCTTEATASNTAWSRRINNSVQWWSPIFSGFQVKLMTALANYQSPGSAAQAAAFPSGLPKPKEYSANATWVRGPLSLGLGYDAHEGLRDISTAGAHNNVKDNAVQLGAKFNFGRGEVGVGYESISYGETAANTGKLTVPTYVVNGRFNIGPGAIWASYSASDAKSCSTATTGVGSAVCGMKPKMYVLGYDYVLSKRTKMYVAYAKIDNQSNGVQGTNYYFIAGPAGNNSNGTASGIQAGTDVNSFGVGVQHVF